MAVLRRLPWMVLGASIVAEQFGRGHIALGTQSARAAPTQSRSAPGGALSSAITLGPAARQRCDFGGVERAGVDAKVVELAREVVVACHCPRGLPTAPGCCER